VPSLGSDFYLAALREAAVVVGNSSSGIIEAPAVGTPTVNIGVRQDGRQRSASVIDAPEQRDAIEAALRRAMEPAMRDVLANQAPAYGKAGQVSRQIFERLRTLPLEGILVKRFHDAGFDAATLSRRAPLRA
jgi:UDP-N-acetylglucosamine 2-epimerase